MVQFDSTRFFRIRIVFSFDSVRLLFDSIRLDSTFIRFNKVESNTSRIEWGPYSTEVESNALDIRIEKIESNALDIRIEKIESNTIETHIQFVSTVEKHYIPSSIF